MAITEKINNFFVTLQHNSKKWNNNNLYFLK